MINRKKLQQLLFLIMLINCCIVLCITSISISTDYWVIVRPYRQLPSSHIILNNNLFDSSTTTTKSSQDSTATNLVALAQSSNLNVNDNTDYLNSLFGSSSEEDDDYPIDLHAKKDCKRHMGKIRFGLFRGVWLLNYGYGCKNRANRVSIYEMVTKHKIFDQTLWISVVACGVAALVCTFLSALFSFLNILMSPSRVANGPTSLYLWNSVSGFFHVLTLIMFTVQFHIFIQVNVLTKEEQESGWISKDRAQLSWSFYILIISVFFILVNIGLVYATLRIKRSFIDLKHHFDTNMNLIPGDSGLIGDAKANYLQINDPSAFKNELISLPSNQNLECQVNIPVKDSSKKLKRIIDFIY